MRTAGLTEALGGLSAYALPTFILRQDEPNPTGNVYGDWATLHAETLFVRGPKIIAFDSAIAQCLIGPAGTYDISDCTLQKSYGGGGDTVVVQDGVKLPGLTRLVFITLESQSNQTVVDAIDRQFIYLDIGSTIRSALGFAPFILVDNVEVNVVTSLGGNIGDDSNPNPAVQVDNAGVFGVFMGEASNVASNALTGTGSASLYLLSTAANINPNQPGLVTPPTIFNFTSAALLAYIYLLADLPLWNSSPPVTEVASAITNLIHRTNFFVYQPSGANGGPYHTSWVSLATALTSLQGPRRITILVDTGFGPASIPAGSWGTNSCEIEFRGMPSDIAASGAPTVLTLDDGVEFPSTDFIFTDIGVINNNTAIPVIPGNQFRRVQLRGCATLTSAGTQPFFLTQAGIRLRLELHDSSRLILGASPVVTTPNLGLFDLITYDAAFVDNNTLDIDAGATKTGKQTGGSRINPSQVQGLYPVTTGGVYIREFVNGDLVADHLTGNHDLGVQYVSGMTVWDDGNNEILPDNKNVSSPTNYDIDLTSFVPIAGTWKLVVSR